MTAADSARMAARRDSIAKDREKLYNEALAKIAGRENQPAESVYKNIKLFKGQAAGRVLRIMAQGFDPALGVSCAHCHVVGEFEVNSSRIGRISCGHKTRRGHRCLGVLFFSVVRNSGKQNTERQKK